MRELDRQATEVYGIPSLLLMENAGRGVAEIVLSLREALFATKQSAGKILIFCGKGNNAGDGFVAARHLYNRKAAVEVVLLAPAGELKGDAKINFEIIKKMGVQIASSLPPAAPRNDKRRPVIASEAKQSAFDDCHLILDAIFGIGLQSEVTGIYRQAIEWINASGKPVVAIDIPSGLDADTGKVHGVAVKAAVTATMAAPKHGLLRGEGPHYSGEIAVVDIGLPRIAEP